MSKASAKGGFVALVAPKFFGFPDGLPVVWVTKVDVFFGEASLGIPNSRSSKSRDRAPKD